MVLFSFCFFLLLFVIIGVFSILENKHTSDDYLIANRNVKPWMAALSAVATNNSGYMFIGMIGFTYIAGLSSIWLLVGWISGDFLSSSFIHKKLRIQTEKKNAISYASLLSYWQETDFRWMRILGGVITVLFLGTYAAAQLKAGSKALYVMFGWDYSAGAIIGTLIVLAYCFAGGIRASIWTDVAQSFVMITAMTILFFTSLADVGGIKSFLVQLNQVSPGYSDFFPSDMFFGPFLGPILLILGWLFAGFGVIGQPHIMIRFMAINNADNMGRTRTYYYIWYTCFYLLTFGTGLMARLLMPDVGIFDEELALPLLAKTLLSDFFVGLILAGLFAATMSTADSQILSCTASISQDLKLNKSNAYWLNKLITIVVAVLALSIALHGNESVFQLVLIAWSALASAFAPLLTVYALGGKPRQSTAIAMMLTGLAAMLCWHYRGYSEDVYEIMPGILAGFIPFGLQTVWEKWEKHQHRAGYNQNDHPG
ncbi:sodium/proline symporter [Legionella spiritensis]|uniref:sodium/proline symporter n=1 Tax=Legionella spiritensis TaxID=452 RepID=UPI000F70152C|nr:sodium/proline symporter [Legionella spiritensis]VEG90512.1 Propionate transporter [Legionella spiritensis]